MKAEKNLVDNFLKEEVAKGRRKRGISVLRIRLTKLFTFLYENSLSLEEINIKEALHYQGWLSESKNKRGKPYDKSTVNTCVSATSSFYDYLKTTGTVIANPFKELKGIRENKKLPYNVLKEKELGSFLDRLSHFEKHKNLKHQITHYKVHIIAELMYSSGLRIAEAAALNVADIDLDRGLVTVEEGKGGIKRMAFLNEYTKELLKIYIEQVRPLIFNQWNRRNGNLLFGVKWESLSKVVNRTLKHNAQKMGLQSFTSHGFRHALGFHLLRAGCNIRYIQSILGHRRLRNTEIYTKVEKEDLKEVLDTYHPRSRCRRIDDEQA